MKPADGHLAAMPTREYITTIKAPLAAVWAFHEDVMRALPALSPPGDQVQLESVDLPQRVGSKLVIIAKGPLGKVRWEARIVEHVPPHAVIFGQEARFVDVQDAGPFKAWRHSHEFESVDSSTTRLVDRITYTVGFGPLGWIADLLLVRRKLNAMFAHRHAMTRKLLEK